MSTYDGNYHHIYVAWAYSFMEKSPALCTSCLYVPLMYLPIWIPYPYYTQYPIIRNGDQRPLVEFLKISKILDTVFPRIVSALE